jgi:hypothetical protein
MNRYEIIQFRAILDEEGDPIVLYGIFDRRKKILTEKPFHEFVDAVNQMSKLNPYGLEEV